jgi:hypothetical protein
LLTAVGSGRRRVQKQHSYTRLNPKVVMLVTTRSNILVFLAVLVHADKPTRRGFCSNFAETLGLAQSGIALLVEASLLFCRETTLISSVTGALARMRLPLLLLLCVWRHTHSDIQVNVANCLDNPEVVIAQIAAGEEVEVLLKTVRVDQIGAAFAERGPITARAASAISATVQYLRYAFSEVILSAHRDGRELVDGGVELFDGGLAQKRAFEAEREWQRVGWAFSSFGLARNVIG